MSVDSGMDQQETAAPVVDANARTFRRARMRETVVARLETLAAQIGVGVAVGLLFAWLAPFETARADAFTRIGYWIILLTGWFPISAFARLASELSPVRTLPRPAVLAIRYLTPIPPMMVVAGLVTRQLFEWHGRPIEIAELFLQVVVVGYALEALGALVHPKRGQETHPPPPSEGAPASLAPASSLATSGSPAAPVAVADDGVPTDTWPRLMQRVPHPLRAAILCLQMEDHYVRIHTRRGSCLVLMRFGDAIEELDGEAGLKVHRSWWIAESAFDRLELSAKAGRVILSTGQTVPVSRPYLDAAANLDRSLRSRRAASPAG